MSDQNKPVRIVHLKTSNFLAIGAEGVEITPDHKIVNIVGKNGAGKSSVLRSIFCTLQGKGTLPPVPIHTGAQKSETEINFGDFTATMNISASKGTTITVKSKGVPIRSPMDFLKGNTNEILLDLTGFMDLGKTPEGRRKQRATLARLVNVDTTELDANKDKLFKERTEVNREKEQAEHKLLSFPLDPTAPKEEIKVTELMTSIQANTEDANRKLKIASGKNDQNNKVRENRKSAADSLDEACRLNAYLQNEIAKLEAALLEKQKDKHNSDTVVIGNKLVFETLNEEASKLKDEDLDVINSDLKALNAPLEQRIKDADEANTKFRAAKRRIEIEEDVSAKSFRAQLLTNSIVEIEEEKTKLMAGVKFPIEGLGFNEDGITLDGLPLEQGSTAHQLRVIAAIGFAFEPKIRVALIRDASLFDDETLIKVAEMAERFGGQIWQEKVARMGPDGKPIHDPFTILIEDGAVKE